MNLKDQINKFFESKGLKLSVEEKKMELAAMAKTIEGVEVGTPTEFAVDAEVYVIVDGETQPAPDGEHILEDGKIIVVSGGKITEIKEKETEVEVETELSAELQSTLGQLADRISALEARNTELSSQLVAEKANVSELTAKLSAAQAAEKTAKSELEKLSKLPAAASVTDKKVELKKTDATPAPAKPYSAMTPAERVAYQREKLGQN